MGSEQKILLQDRGKKVKHQREGGLLVSQVDQLSNKIFSQILKKHKFEIHPGQGRVLFVLWRNDGISMNELRKKTIISKSTLTGIIDGLENTGQVKRTRSTDDRRKIFINLTEEGIKSREKAVKVSQEMTEIFYKGISDQEIDQFEKTLQKILNNLNSQRNLGN